MQNKRLEQIHKDWMNANMSEHGFFDSSKLAEHFYSLALEDVRKEVAKEIKHSRDSEAFSSRESVENGVGYYNSGKIDVLVKLENFIDQLSK